ncbi:hypothetical protein like AT2G44640 [Hibiscus trionum]|uniref:Protein TRIGALACTOSYLDIACYLGLYCEROL 4, chloroplastic n=1 Tax=Hibiscus trionum TaxID=183268 RepID=A0A9W7HBI7_HIBTR|nr:hypothetical protein like AT2G44640 [Hibiscus trionum]
MANLVSAMDSAFWDQTISTPQTLDGSAKSVPGEPFPLDGARASKALRIQQLSLLGKGFPLGIIPSLSPPSRKDLGSFSLQSLLLKPAASNWWVGLIGQFRPKKLISAIKTELQNADEWELSVFGDAAKHFLDKSMYSIALATQISLPPSFLMWSSEWHGEKKGYWNKFKLYHQLPDHDITLDAAWPELFMDHDGRYWEVPESISLDMSSLPSGSGLLYRFGIHKNSGSPHSFNALESEAPSTLLPGICAKAAFSYEKKKDFWRRKETIEDLIVKTDKGLFWQPSYDIRLKEPHAAISGILGGAFAAWFGKDSANAAESHREGNNPTTNKTRSPLDMDLFGSVCYTFQHGQFRKLYGDLTRVDARVDICSLPSFAKRVLGSRSSADTSLSSPRLNLIFQQQVAGPIVFRIDLKLLLDSKSGKRGPHMEDLIYSLSYSFRLLRSGKVVAWFSPKRNEGMVELRLFEF